MARRLAVLAGGRSRRMGRPKAAIELGGRPLIAHPIAAGRTVGLEPVVIAKPHSELPDTGCEIVVEPAEPVHPLLGIAVALERFGEPIVVAPCDMPLLPPALLGWLAERREPVVVAAAPRLQPLVGRYAPAVAGELRAAAEAGAPAGEAVMELDPHLADAPDLAAFGDPASYLANVNDPADLDALRRARR